MRRVDEGFGSPTYIERGFRKPQKSFLDNKQYAAALDALGVDCVDIVVVNKQRETFFLIKRKTRPYCGKWWWFGGKIDPGELRIDAARRKMKQEAGLKLPRRRFIPVMQSRHFCKDREQEPQNVGYDSRVWHFAVELSDEEIARASSMRDQKEFGGRLREFNREGLVRARVTLPVIDLYDKVFPR